MDERFGIAVPLEMREHYTLSNGNRVNNVATYGRFRRFAVSAEEEIHTPRPDDHGRGDRRTFVSNCRQDRFTMGSGSEEAGRNDDETLHDVELTKPFFLGRTGSNPAGMAHRDGHHAESIRDLRTAMPGRERVVSRRAAVSDEAERARRRAQARGRKRAERALRFRLPTEAEWEYACRARTTGPFSTGENLTTAQANYNGKQPYAAFPAGEFRQQPTPVGTFPLNPWGLADMHGNVWEWTADWYGPYAETATANIDPHGPLTGEKRVIRGGAWNFDANSARCGLRYTHAPQDRGFGLGFRLAADPLL